VRPRGRVSITAENVLQRFYIQRRRLICQPNPPIATTGIREHTGGQSWRYTSASRLWRGCGSAAPWSLGPSARPMKTSGEFLRRALHGHSPKVPAELTRAPSRGRVRAPHIYKSVPKNIYPPDAHTLAEGCKWHLDNLWALRLRVSIRDMRRSTSPYTSSRSNT
jgi:hypothetical protein